jgi:hypothetical protein
MKTLGTINFPTIYLRLWSALATISISNRTRNPCQRRDFTAELKKHVAPEIINRTSRYEMYDQATRYRLVSSELPF